MNIKKSGEYSMKSPVKGKRLSGLLTSLFAITVTLSSNVWSNDNKVPDWYLHLNVKGMQQSALVQHQPSDHQQAKQFINLLLGKDAIEQLNDVTAFGFGEERKVVRLKGNFENHKNNIVNQWQILGLTSNESHNKVEIYHNTANDILKRFHALAKAKGLIDPEDEFEVSEQDKQSKTPTVLYTAIASSQHVLVSDHLGELKHQLTQTTALPKQNPDSMFEVIVDVKKALLHGGVNIDGLEQSNFQFESISAKQLSQASVSYSEQGDYSTLQLGLSADTQEVANNIKAIAKGIIALKRFSNTDPAVNHLLNNIRFEQSGGELLMTVSGSVEAFKRLKDDRKHSVDKQP